MYMYMLSFCMYIINVLKYARKQRVHLNMSCLHVAVSTISVYVIHHRMCYDAVSAAESLIDVSRLPTTRSGRRVLPPLAWWAGQRQVRNDHLGISFIDNGSPNPLLGVDVPVVKSDAVSDDTCVGVGGWRKWRSNR